MPDSNDFVLINTHYDNMLVNEKIDGIPMGNISIVDRQHLLTLFRKVAKQDSHKYIICDVLFDHESALDLELSKAIAATRNHIIPRKDSLQETLALFRDLNSGLVDLATVGGTFFKYKLYNEKLKVKSLPLKVYEDIHNVQIKDYGIFARLGEKLIFNDFVPEHRLNSYNVLEAKSYPMINLNEIIRVNDVNFDSYIKDRILVIGNFNTDMKNTIYGNIPGPLIILNSYLALENGDNKISFLLVFIVLVVFACFSFIIISPKDKIENTLLKIPVVGRFLVGFGFVLSISLIAVVIYLLFNNNLSLAYIGFFFYLENLILHRTHYFEKFKTKFN
nr:CHASE2 domain-containing protein [uncultured Allomuricauda sp.]